MHTTTPTTLRHRLWYKNIMEHCEMDAISIILVGNKSDLVQAKEVSSADGRVLEYFLFR